MALESDFLLTSSPLWDGRVPQQRLQRPCPHLCPGCGGLFWALVGRRGLCGLPDREETLGQVTEGNGKSSHCWGHCDQNLDKTVGTLQGDINDMTVEELSVLQIQRFYKFMALKY
jgi:hypothetical protein